MPLSLLRSAMDLSSEMSLPVPPLANYALLPLLFWRLILSVARQKHSPTTAKTVATEYDYVIVGAGSGGSVVAGRLSELPCVTVLLLEAGKTAPVLTEVPGFGRLFWFTSIDWKYRTAPQRYTGGGLLNRQLVWPSGKTIGGSSVLNAMLYVRGNRKNFDMWEAEGAQGWGWRDVLPYFKKLEDNRDPEYVANGYHGVHGPQTAHRPRYEAEVKRALLRAVQSLGYRVVDSNGPTQTGFFDFQATVRGGQRCSTAKAYLVPADTRKNLDILSAAFVRKVLIQDRRAVGVQFDYGGRTFEVRARKEVIMSAGTVNTAQLLMLSGIGPRKELERFGIPVIADLPVGRNLQDHIGTTVPYVLPSSVPTLTKKILNPLNFEQYIQNRTGPLASCEFCTLLAFLKNRAIAPDVDFPDHQLYFAELVTEVSLQFGITPKVFAQTFLPYLGRPIYACISQLLQPKSRGTVTLRSADPYAPPVIDPNYLEDPRDVEDMVEGLMSCKRVLESPAMRATGLERFQTLYPGCEPFAGNDPLYFECTARQVVATFSHQVGTARMGHPGDPRTVVDPHLRVLSIKGLRVVDASVMPIVPSGNTNAPTIMVAEKASDIIKSTLRCHGPLVDWWNETVDAEWARPPHHHPSTSQQGHSKNTPFPSYLDPPYGGVNFETHSEDSSEEDLEEPQILLHDQSPLIKNIPNLKNKIRNSTPWSEKLLNSIILSQITATNGSWTGGTGKKNLNPKILREMREKPSKSEKIKIGATPKATKSRVKSKLQSVIQKLLMTPLADPTILNNLRNLKIN